METRMPLTDIFASQAQRTGRKKMEKFYGKKSSCSSNAGRSNIFIDENDVASLLAGMQITPPIRPLPRGSSNETPVERKKRTKERFLSRVEVHQQMELYQRTKPQDLQRDLPPVFKAQDVSRVRSLFLQANHPWNQGLQTFVGFAQKLSKDFSATKIAEGSYGEAYRMNALRLSADLKIKEGVVLKIIPIDEELDPDKTIGSTVAQLVQEVKIHKVLDSIPGFVRFRDVSVVQGQYPSSFLEAFRDFQAIAGNDARNEDPETKFEKQQQFAIFDMSHAGLDLESLRVPSAFQIYDIFWSVVILLTNAENTVEFEHRDLHVGNVCIKSRSPGGRIDINSMVNASMDTLPGVTLGLSHIATGVIDYTMSRATFNLKTGEVAFNVFVGHDFNAKGNDAEEKLQNDAYRRMRDSIKRADTDAKTTGLSADSQEVHSWSRFVPQTNVIWLIYLLAVLCGRSKGNALEGSSQVSKKLQEKMFTDFEQILKRFKSCTLKKLPTSAGDLLQLGLDEGLLTEADIESFRDSLDD